MSTPELVADTLPPQPCRSPGSRGARPPAGPGTPPHRLNRLTASPVTKEGPMTFYRTEAKPQGWRALAVLADRTERLLYLGRSTTQVRAGYAQAYQEVLDEE